MLDPQRVLIATVAEDRQPYTAEAVCLFRSLRGLGGELAGARAVAYLVGSIDPVIEGQLSALEVAIRVVPRLEPRCPHANKLHMLDGCEDCDYLVALDTDTVVARDFSAYVQGSSVRARPAGKDPISLDQWRALFAHFGLEMPQARYVTSHDAGETIPYFNSGVLIVPGEHILPLREAWLRYVRALLDAYEQFPDIAEYRAFTDQIALPLALTEARLPYCALPLEMNFLAHTRVHPAMGPELLSPYILHHHHGLLPDGKLKHTGYLNIDAAINRVNAATSSPVPSARTLEEGTP